jgi:hypothetical protein
MSNVVERSNSSLSWDTEAIAMVAQAKVLSGNKLEQLVLRLQRHTGRPRDACWRCVVHRGIKASVDHRRWTEGEVDFLREELVKHPLDEVARRLKRTPEAVRSILKRNHLSLRDIRCDLFSVESLARALRVGRPEVLFWIEQEWLPAAVSIRGGKRFHTITPEALTSLYKKHLEDLLKRGLPSQTLFEAYLEYCHAPKHTTRQQLLSVRQDKREREAYAAAQEGEEEEEVEGQDDVEERHPMDIGPLRLEDGASD